MRVLVNMIVRISACGLRFENGAPKAAFKHRLLLLLDEFPARVLVEAAPKLSGPGEILQRAQSLRPLVRRQALASVYKCLRIFQRGRASDRRGLAVSKAIAAFAICYLLTVN